MKIRYLFIVVLLVVLSCSNDNDHDSVLGQWQCEEYYESGDYQRYIVAILHDPQATDTTRYVISNFYQMGTTQEYYVYFQLKGDSLLIDDQIVSGNNFSISNAKGTVASDYSEINIKYQIQTGSKSEYVEATYN